MNREKKLRGGRSGAGFDVNPQNINEEGRPDTPFTWREQFMKIAQEKKGQLHRIEVAAQRMWKKMEVEGDVKAFEKIADRMEGRAKDTLDVTSKGEKIQGFVVDLIHEAKNKDSGNL